jgi:hypothetical protein
VIKYELNLHSTKESSSINQSFFEAHTIVSSVGNNLSSRWKIILMRCKLEFHFTTAHDTMEDGFNAIVNWTSSLKHMQNYLNYGWFLIRMYGHRWKENVFFEKRWKSNKDGSTRS